MRQANPFAVLTTPPPGFSASQVAEVLREAYNLEGDLKQLVGERDQNFLLTLQRDEHYLFKLSNSAETPAVTDLQNSVLLHLEELAPAIPIPRLVQTTSGERTLVMTAEDGRTHSSRMLTWIPGTPLRLAEPASSIAVPMGALLASLGTALADFEHPASQYPLLWDMMRADELSELLGHIDDMGLRELCGDHLVRFSSELRPALLGLRRQLIYNDLNPSNILVNSAMPEQIVGIIDFGDIIHAPLIIDVAVACAYLCTDDPSSLGEIEAFVRGYHDVSPLMPEEIDLLPDLVRTRHIMTMLITNWRASQYPENRDYILRNETSARITLDMLTDIEHGKFTNRLHEICGH